MSDLKRTRLEGTGWRVGNAADFLGLSDSESSYVEMKLTLSRELKQRRQSEGLSQVQLARKVGSSQSRVAKMEAGDPSVSVDLLIRALLAVGASPKEIGNAFGGGRPAMKIRNITANNRRKAFEIETPQEVLPFPYARLRVKPTRENRVSEVYADPELGHEAFTYVLENGEEDSIHLDEVLEYNEDADYLRNFLLYKLTLEAEKRVGASALSKREIIRRLGTSASQFYRLLDSANSSKSVGQLLALLHVLDCDVDLVVRKRRRRTAYSEIRRS